MELRSRVAVITGGASGLGWATARYLCLERGMKVALLDLPASRGVQAAAELTEEAGAEVVSFHPVDVSNERQVRQVVTEVAGYWGGAQVLVNAAGIPGTTRILSRNGQPVGAATFAHTLQVNLLGTFLVLSEVSALMARNEPTADGERGVVINVASVAAYEGSMGHVAYAASKAGVIGMMLPAARELATHGIRVLTIAPGFFPTPMAHGIDQKVRDQMTSTILFPHRFGNLNEFARLVADLCENVYLNAEVIRIDGGLRLPR